MNNEDIRYIIQEVVYCLINSGLLETSEEVTKENYIDAINEIRPTALKKLEKKLSDKILSDNIESLIKEKIDQGFNIGIECKGNDKEIYKGTASNVNAPFEDKMFEPIKYYGTGNTIEELLDSMFNKQNKKKKKPKDC